MNNCAVLSKSKWGGSKNGCDMEKFTSGFPEILPFRNPYGKVGRPLNYTPQRLAEKFAEFVEWCRTHPIPITETTISARADVFEKTRKAPRMVSVGAFLVFLGEDKSWWSRLDTRENGEEFVNLKSRISTFCENYQIEMASTGLFKENIISRLLGLADKQNASVEVGVSDDKTPLIEITTRRNEATDSDR